jgi:hypothetical protein
MVKILLKVEGVVKIMVVVIVVVVVTNTFATEDCNCLAG